jgi:hypothetical protein
MSEGPRASIETVITVVTALLGMLPPALTATGVYPLSLYQPVVYNHKEYFLVIPVIVALVAAWSILHYPRSKTVVAVLSGTAVVLALLVWYLFEAYPATHPVHPFNWVLSYCVVAIVLALLGSVVIAFTPAKGISGSSATTHASSPDKPLKG